MRHEPSRERTFLAVYPALSRLRDAGDAMACVVGNFFDYSESSDPEAREIGNHPAKAPSEGGEWFEPEATQLRQALDDEMLRDLPEELFQPLKEGLFLVSNSIGLDDSSGLRRAEERLELGWESVDAFVTTMAAKVFGQWGGMWFGLCAEFDAAGKNNLFDESLCDPAGYSPILLNKILSGPIPDIDGNAEAILRDLRRKKGAEKYQKETRPSRTKEKHNQVRVIFEKVNSEMPDAKESEKYRTTADRCKVAGVECSIRTIRGIVSEKIGND